MRGRGASLEVMQSNICQTWKRVRSHPGGYKKNVNTRWGLLNLKGDHSVLCLEEKVDGLALK